jgi:hypothetical protein
MKHNLMKVNMGIPSILRKNVKRVGEVFYLKKLLIADIISLSAAGSNTSSDPRQFHSSPLERISGANF